jgi:ATP-dependent RNA helicase DDX49/DBP8
MARRLSQPQTGEWESLGLSPWLASNCVAMGLRKPSPIQAACVGPALKGQDVLGSAETGSGKTAAFVLPVLQALSEDPFGVFAVVLSPARELAAQIGEQFTALGARMQLRVALAVGGVDMMRQALQLAERPHVVIGTPGRLADHLRSSGTAATMRHVRFLVIDEADRLLELGFASDLSDIVQRLPTKRQTLLFSATMSRSLQRLQRLALQAPHVADLAPLESVPATLTLEYIFMPANVRDAYLSHVLGGLKGETAIVFTSTCRACEELACTLRALGHSCAPLHSQQPQPRRHAAIGKFKQGSLPVLIATDVAARGIDSSARTGLTRRTVGTSVPSAASAPERRAPCGTAKRRWPLLSGARRCPRSQSRQWVWWSTTRCPRCRVTLCIGAGARRVRAARAAPSPSSPSTTSRCCSPSRPPSGAI